MWTAIDFTVDKKTHAPLPADHLVNMTVRAKNKGLLIKLAPVRQAFEFAPPLTIQKEEIDEALKIIEECIAEEEKEMGL
jgi:4-aminobutyrate aminotransferase-like enzyme